MNELEQQIRKLKLRPPGDALDQRMHSLLLGSDVNAMPESKAAVTLATSLCASDRIRTRRGIFSATFAGVVAALLFGIAIGNGLPSLWSVSGLVKSRKSLPTATEEAVLSAQEMNSESEARHRMQPDLPPRVREALQSQSTVGSQFVESSYLSAIMGAAIWERQNGEIFSVTTHVSDRRFDMCRDCHRVGG